MKDLHNGIEKSELDDVAEMEAMEKILKKQRYPIEVEKCLGKISEESGRTGWPYIVIKAYGFGVIMGKRYERRKKHT